LLAWGATHLGLTPLDWFTDAPLFAVILIVAWEWLPFATLILLTALQSQDEEQKEAAEMDWRERAVDVHLSHIAASRAADHRWSS
jgi:sorbitol/mannitol transport system permease protein